MSEPKSWFRQPRYSPLNLVVFLALMMGIMSVGTYWVVALCARQFSAQLQTREQEIIKGTMVNPLPAVTIPAAPKPAKVYQQNYDFSIDWAAERVPVWVTLYATIRGKPNLNYLEVGSFEGGSLLWMLENVLTGPTARATAVDVFQGEYKDTYRRNIERSGFADKVTTLTGFSQVVLRGLPLDSYDIIYIDGSHVQCDVLEDAVLSWRLLKVGGLLVFDDYLWVHRDHFNNWILGSPKFAIDPFVQCFKDKCEVIHNGEQLIIRKTRE